MYNRDREISQQDILVTMLKDKFKISEQEALDFMNAYCVNVYLNNIEKGYYV